jgi:hypothetical protein
MLPSSAACALTGESTAKDDCIGECEEGRLLINLGRNSKRADRTQLRTDTPNSCETNPVQYEKKNLLGKSCACAVENLGFFVPRGHPLLRSWPMVIANRIGVPSAVW